ncbi:putative efflux pump antibiotic resistance protein [Nemania sp. FL0031]|nr:putative efflux pump antibiotic resistance protein [Nemania sp. FL0031]
MEQSKEKEQHPLDCSGTSAEVLSNMDEKDGNSGNHDSIAIGIDDDAKGPDTVEYPHGFKLAMIVVALVLSMFLISIDLTIVSTAIPKITDEFQSLLDVAWYGSAFFITIGSFQSTWGKAYKYFPLKIVFLLSIFIFELGSLVCAVAPNSHALIVGRALAGLGAAGVSGGTYTIIAFAAEPSKRPAYTGLLGATYGIASVVGPLVGGVLTDRVTWRWCFYLNLPIGGASAIIILLFFQTPPTAKPVEAPLKEKILQMDPVGTTLLLGGIISYILALQYGGTTYSWNSSVVIGLLVGFVVIMVFFAVFEIWQGEKSMLVPRILKNRVVAVGSAFQFFFAGSYYAVLYYLPIYFQSIHNVSPTQSGVRNLPLILSLSLFTLLSGGFITSTGIATPLQVAGALIATAGCGTLYTLSIGTTTGQWIGYQLLAGIGWGIGFQVPIIMAQSSVQPADIASATATILFFQTVGGAFLVAAAQAAFVNRILTVLPGTAPNIDPFQLISVGATEIRSLFPTDQIPGIIAAYMDGITVALTIALATVAFSALLSVFSPWKRLKSS